MPEQFGQPAHDHKAVVGPAPETYPVPGVGLPAPNAASSWRAASQEESPGGFTIVDLGDAMLVTVLGKKLVGAVGPVLAGPAQVLPPDSTSYNVEAATPALPAVDQTEN